MLRAFKKVCKYVREKTDIDMSALEPLDYDLSKIICPACRAHGAMSYHNNYERHFIWAQDGCINERLISVDCLYCCSCKSYHALLPISVIPYLSYSVIFIAQLISDWLDKTWPDIEALCEHYRISVKTFMRLRRRFSVCTVLAFGLTGKEGSTKKAATDLCCADIDSLDMFLSDFFNRTGRSFCQHFLT